MIFRNRHNLSAHHSRTASPEGAGTVNGSVVRLESIGGVAYRVDAIPSGGTAP